MILAGLRFDTSSGGDRWNQGSGPRWRKKKRKPRGFTAKYAPVLATTDSHPHAPPSPPRFPT